MTIKEPELLRFKGPYNESKESRGVGEGEQHGSSKKPPTIKTLPTSGTGWADQLAPLKLTGGMGQT